MRSGAVLRTNCLRFSGTHLLQSAAMRILICLLLESSRRSMERCARHLSRRTWLSLQLRVRTSALLRPLARAALLQRQGVACTSFRPLLDLCTFPMTSPTRPEAENVVRDVCCIIPHQKRRHMTNFCNAHGPAPSTFAWHGGKGSTHASCAQEGQSASSAVKLAVLQVFARSVYMFLAAD